MTDSESERRYIVVVDYESDTERKRAEYLLDNYDEGEIERVRGLTRIASGVDIDQLYQKLAAKVPEEAIQLFDVDEVEATATEKTRNLNYDYDVAADRVTWAMESLLKKRESAKREAGGDIDVWSVYTKKGRARIKYNIVSTGEETTKLDITITGWGEAPAFLAEYVDEQLSYMVF